MRIALVRPTIGHTGRAPYRSWAMMEPLVIAVLAGMTPPEHEVRFYDERLERVPLDEPVDLVAITVETYAARRAYQLADAFRRRGVRVVLGGFHPSLLPDEAAPHADAVIVGEAERLWPEVLADAAAGRLRPRYHASERAPLDGLRVDRTIFRGKPYLPLALVQYARGCPHACDFCAIHQVYGRRVVHRPVAEVLAEIDGLSTRNVFFVDDNLTADRRAACELFTALKARRIRWTSQVELSVANDPALLDLMAASGCFALTIGLESLNGHNLALMGKSWAPRPEEYARALAAIKARGILVYGAFIFGYDGDTREAFDRTLDFALAQRLFIATFNLLQPFPGTPLHARLRDEGRLLYDRWWLDEGFTWDKPAFRPARMTPEELTDACFSARRRFTGAGSILRRGLDLQAHLRDPFRAMLYLAGNLVARQDIARKQGLSLGYADDEARGCPA